jgi:hypothetical protein
MQMVWSGESFGLKGSGWEKNRLIGRGGSWLDFVRLDKKLVQIVALHICMHLAFKRTVVPFKCLLLNSAASYKAL